MKSKTFAVGFSVSLILLVACGVYTFLPPTSGAILPAYDRTLHGWIIHRPTGYNIAVLSFALLNMPPLLATELVLLVVDSCMVLAPAMRAALVLVTAGTGSAIWWLLLARWKARGALRRR